MSAAASPVGAMAEFNGLTAEQLHALLQAIASSANTLRQFAMAANEAARDDDNAWTLQMIAEVAGKIGGLAATHSAATALVM